MTTRVLLLGGSGFLGSHILTCLDRTAGVEVTTAGRRRPSLAHPHTLVDLVEVTVSDLAGLVAGSAADVVINAAGLTTGASDAQWATNVAGMATLLGALRRAGAPVRLVHLGSAAEYGAVPPGRPVTEDTPPDPTSDYGATKLAATQLVLAARAMGLDAVVLRVFNPLGPGAPGTTLAGRVVAELQRPGPAAEIHLGPLDDYRDFVDVRDVAEAAVAAALARAVECPVLNVGSGQATPIRAVVDELVAIAGFTGRIREGDRGATRSRQVPWQQADVATAARCLGWRPRTTLSASLRDLWRDHLRPGIWDAGSELRVPHGDGAGEVSWTTSSTMSSMTSRATGSPARIAPSPAGSS